LTIVDGNLVHFADLHPQTLYLYDLHSRQASPLYPQAHDAFREDFSRRLKAAIVEDQCRKNNWGCQTERFTTHLSYPIEINNETQAIAFRASFDPEDSCRARKRNGVEPGTTMTTRTFFN